MQTIMIVEDDPDIRDGVRILLSGEGYRILEAENGPRALSLLTPEVDLVILDIMMPGMSGLRVCEEIRKISTVPILFLTAKSQESDKLLGLTAGGDDYLAKPFGMMELLARIKALLRRTEDRAIAISELSQELKNIPGPVYLAGDGAKLVFDTLKEENLPLRLIPEHLRQQRASGVALTAMEKIAAGEPADAAALTPNYLRQAQAERTRQHDKDFYLKK